MYRDRCDSISSQIRSAYRPSTYRIQSCEFAIASPGIATLASALLVIAGSSSKSIDSFLALTRASWAAKSCTLPAGRGVEILNIISSKSENRYKAKRRSATCCLNMASLLPCTCGTFAKEAQQQWTRRLISTSRAAQRAGKQRQRQDELRYNFNPNPFDPVPVDDAQRATYPTVTAHDLRKHANPPRKVRMLARDFIDDSLYNPHYGYFPKQAVIFDPDAAVLQKSKRDVAAGKRRARGFDFASMKNMAEWDRAVAETYGILEEADEKASGLGRQVWHTPTELFKVSLPSATFLHG